jgi:membrane protein YqaA with SNARE-associated domain
MGLLEGFVFWAQEIAGAWGYLGIFLVNFLGTATIFLPVPAFIVVFLFGGILNPWLVGITAGIGAALGELTGYLIGMGGEAALKKRYGKWILKGEKWFRNNRAFPFIVIFAATPLPDDVLGILCGMFSYNWKRFLLASLIGKLIMNLALAWGGFFGVAWVLQAFGGGI